jgi:GT2 family glycosyltransferase
MGTRPVPVIILNWNGWEDTFACLQSIRKQGDECQVWLVDNGSKNDRRDEAALLHPGLRTLRWDDNYGWAGGYNRALRMALDEGHRFAYLLNNDCLVTPWFLRSAVDAATGHPDIAAVGSYIAYAAAPDWLQFDGAPNDEGDRPVAGGLPTKPASRLSGAGMLLDLRAFRECGPFDERLFCYWDDTEWCSRAREGGWRLLMAGGSLLLHRGNRSDVDFNALYYLHRNRYLVNGRRDLRMPPAGEMRYVLGGLRFANQLRREGRSVEARAIVAGFWDGWTGKTGRRRGDPAAPITFLLSHCWPPFFPARAGRSFPNR